MSRRFLTQQELEYIRLLRFAPLISKFMFV